MALYGKHRYFDVSKLNARWDHAFMPPGWPNPPLMGLGSVAAGSLSGNALGMRGLGDETDPSEVQSVQYKLNMALIAKGFAPVPLTSTYDGHTCGGLAAMGMYVPDSCKSFTAPKLSGTTPIRQGETVVEYPWQEYSDSTKELQQAANVALAKRGYNPIGTDGKLGPGTCGAIEMLSAEVAMTIPSTCQRPFTAPTKVGAYTPSSPISKQDTPIAPVQRAGMFGGSANWLLIGAGVAVAAVGVAVVLRKNKHKRAA